MALQKALGQALQPTTSWRISSRPEGSAGPRPSSAEGFAGGPDEGPAGPRPSSARLDDRGSPPHHPEHGPTHGVTFAPAEGFAGGSDEGPAGPGPSSALPDDRDLSLHPAADHDGAAFGPVEGHGGGLVGGLAEGLTGGPTQSPADCLAHGLADSQDHPDPRHDAASPAVSGKNCSLVQLPAFKA